VRGISPDQVSGRCRGKEGRDKGMGKCVKFSSYKKGRERSIFEKKARIKTFKVRKTEIN